MIPGKIILLIGITIFAFHPPINADTVGDRLAKQDHVLNCQGRHLSDGSGVSGRVPKMKDFLGNFLKVEGGREYLIRVPGSAYSRLDDTRQANVMNWMLNEFSPNHFPIEFLPYTRLEIARYRNNPLAEVGSSRDKLIKNMEVL